MLPFPLLGLGQAIEHPYLKTNEHSFRGGAPPRLGRLFRALAFSLASGVCARSHFRFLASGRPLYSLLYTRLRSLSSGVCAHSRCLALFDMPNLRFRRAQDVCTKCVHILSHGPVGFDLTAVLTSTGTFKPTIRVIASRCCGWDGVASAVRR